MNCPNNGFNSYRILHVFLERYNYKHQKYSGATKDIIGHYEYFKNNNYIITELTGKDYKSIRKIINSKSESELSQFDVILIEMTYLSRLIKIFRRRGFTKQIYIRAHNAELFHRIDWARAQNNYKDKLKSLCQAALYLRNDIIAARNADAILSICQWEIDHYWSYFTSKSKIVYVPFFLPSHYTKDLMYKREDKENICVQFGASSHNPMITDSVQKFEKLVEKIVGYEIGWKFYVTGEIQNDNIYRNNKIKYTGWMPNPYKILKNARVMVLLTEYGYGFKTKILEAIDSGLVVVVSENIYNRLPEALHPYCLFMEENTSESFKEILNKSLSMSERGPVNNIFRTQAYQALDTLFNK